MASADGDSNNGSNPPQKFELTEEEKGVLIECRRKSLMRGVPIGVVALLATRAFAARASPSSMLRRWNGLFSGVNFLFGVFVGVTSYKEECFRKIMQLENSRLKDQVLIAKGHMEECMEKEKGRGEQREAVTSRREDRSDGSRFRPRNNRSPPQQQQQQQQQQQPKKSDRMGPVQSDDNYAMESMQQQQQYQPSAFQDGSSARWNVAQEQESTDPYGDPSDHQKHPTQGRTFDDIRAENRRRQFTPVTEGASGGGEGEGDGSSRNPEHWRRRGRDQPQITGSDPNKKPVRRNKYGDVIVDDD